MTDKRHALVGWIVTQIGVRMARRAIHQKKQSLAENRTKIGAAGIVALVLIGGVVAAKVTSGDD
ncbi:MAG TPA: hypothetical protein VGI67_09620 [Thermoleophilaceae bacterium]|jgi:hypothetical protein